MTDYWLSKLFFDLQHDAQLVTDYRADMAAVIERYRIKPEVRRALHGRRRRRAVAAGQCLSAALLFSGPRHAARRIHGAAARDEPAGAPAAAKVGHG